MLDSTQVLDTFAAEPTVVRWLIAIALLAAAGLYAYAILDFWRHGSLPSLRQRGLIRDHHPTLFALGLAAIAVALLSPVDELADLRFSAHMIQHMLLMMVAAPLTLLGLPSPVARGALGNRNAREILGRISDPPVGYLAFNANLLLWHIPGLYGLALRNEWIHALQHALFFYTALLFWWRVIDATHGWYPMWRWPPAKWLYLLVAAPPSYALGTILWAGGRLLYLDYAEVGGSWALTPLADQQLGGLFMWLQGWMFLMVSMAIFFVWYDPELEQA